MKSKYASLRERAIAALADLTVAESEQVKRYVDYIAQSRRRLWPEHPAWLEDKFEWKKLCQDRWNVLEEFAAGAVQGLINGNEEKYWMYYDDEDVIKRGSPPQKIGVEAQRTAHMFMSQIFHWGRSARGYPDSVMNFVHVRNFVAALLCTISDSIPRNWHNEDRDGGVAIADIIHTFQRHYRTLDGRFLDEEHNGDCTCVSGRCDLCRVIEERHEAEALMEDLGWLGTEKSNKIGYIKALSP